MQKVPSTSATVMNSTDRVLLSQVEHVAGPVTAVQNSGNAAQNTHARDVLSLAQPYFTRSFVIVYD
jgi:hypothetical protein